MKHILIADDKPGSREFLRTVLEYSGYQVTEAADGQEAIEQASNEIDLFLLDLQMPRLDGFGVVRLLREKPEFANVPMVALTASAMQGDRERALAAGFSAYIVKPVSLPVLRAELTRLTGEQA
jgi:CheY-like chemotaxis protein